MKRVLSLICISATCLATLGQTGGVTNDALRNEAGFLIVPGEVPAPIPAAPPLPVLAPATNSSATAQTGKYALDDKHKLLPGDKVSFQIIEDRTNAVPLAVAESSELDIPYIGRLSIADKTCKELADQIKTLLEKDFYYRATVIIGLDSLSKVLGKVYVWGPVRNQGPIEIPANENFTAGKAILRAGGFGDFANKKEVKIVRKTPTGNVTLKVNMVDVLEKGKTDADIELQPEDFIIVAQRAFNL